MNFIQRHRRPLSATLVAILIVALVIAIPHQARADVAGTLASWLAQLAYYILQFMVKLLGTIVQIMVAVAQYNDFLKAPAVVRGWVIVRDLSNMFFIVVLLIIAFGTILQLENYRYNRLLARLIVMAVLINFSKFIAGFFIDFAQVVMLTFVNVWREATYSNIINALGLYKVVSLVKNTPTLGTDVNEGAVLTAVLLGLAVVTIAAVVMAIIAFVLIIRILALWFLITLSPLAYLFRTYPSTEKYASRWWSEFGKYVITGPVVAFLLWLTLAIMSQPGALSDQVLNPQVGIQQDANGIGSANASAGAVSATITEIGKSDVLLSYITGIMLLVGTLVITKELGVAGGQLAGQAAEKIKGYATKAATIGAGVAIGANGGFGLAATGAAYAGRKQIGQALNLGGRRLDEMSIRAQQGEGPLKGIYGGLKKTRLGHYLQAHPVSLRPSMVKKAYQDYRHSREEGIYGKAQGGMRDVFNAVTSGGRKQTNYAYLAEQKEVKARESELRQGSTRKEAMLKELKSIVDFERGPDGKITGAKIRSGEGARFQAGLRIMTQNHDINEVIKDGDFGQLLQHIAPDKDEKNAQTVGPQVLLRFLKEMFGEHEAAEISQDLGEIGFQYNDPWMYTMTEVDKEGRLRLIDEEGMAQKDGKEYGGLKRYDPEANRDAAGNPTSWVDFSKNMSLEQKQEYRDHYDDTTNAKRAEILAGYNQKRENRRIATLARRQDFAPEVGFGNGNMYFRRELGIMGERLVRDVLSTMTDYRYASPETKQMFQERLDVLKAFADSGQDGGEKYKKLTGGIGPQVKVEEDQRKGIYRLIGLAMGIEGKDADKLGKNPDAISPDLDALIANYQGGMASDGSMSKFAMYELEKNRLIEENRTSTPDRAGFDTLSDDRAAVLLDRIMQQAATKAGLDTPPKLAPPVGIVAPGREGPGAAPTGSPATAAASTGGPDATGGPTPTPGPGPAPTTPPPPPAGAPLRDIDRARYDATRQKVAAFEARYSVGSFFKSDEYKNNKDSFVDEATFEQAQDLEQSAVSPIGGIGAFGRANNPSNVLAFDARKFASGKFRDRAGHYLSDPQDVRGFLTEYDGLLQQEYEQLSEKAEKTDGDRIRMEHLEGAHQRITATLAGSDAGLKNLRVINTARTGYSARHVVGHEETHARLDAIDPDRAFRKQMLADQSQAERQAMVEGMRVKMGNSNMTDEEAFDEYLAEGLTNSWKSWADTSPEAVTLDPGMMSQIQNQAETVGKQRALAAGLSEAEAVEAGRKNRFMVSGETPELGGNDDTVGAFRSGLAALGQKLSQKSEKLTDDLGAIDGKLTQWSLGLPSKALEGLVQLDSKLTSATGEIASKVLANVFGSQLGQAITDKLRGFAVGRKSQPSAAVQPGAATVRTGRTPSRPKTGGPGIVGANIERAQDFVQGIQQQFEARKVKLAVDLQEDARQKNLAHQRSIQDLDQTKRGRGIWQQAYLNRDGELKNQITGLETQRQQAVSTGNVGQSIALGGQISTLRKQREELRKDEKFQNDRVAKSEQAVSLAEAEARAAINRAESESTKVFGPRIQVPPDARQGLTPEEFSQLEAAVSDYSNKQNAYQTLQGPESRQAMTEAAQKLEQLTTQFTQVAAQRAQQQQTSRVSQPSSAGPTQERRQVTEEVKEVREAAPTERTERVVEERPAPPTERTERVVEQRAESAPRLAETTGGQDEEGASGILGQILSAIEQGNAVSQSQLTQLEEVISSGNESAMAQAEATIKRLEDSAGKTAEAIKNSADQAGGAEGKSFDKSYEQKRTTEYLRELVQKQKEKEHTSSDKPATPPQKGPGGEPL